MVRTHIFAHQLFETKEVIRWHGFLSREETIEVATTYKVKHLTGIWLADLWDLQPVYTMIESGIWDIECREMVNLMLDKGNLFTV